MRLRRFYACRFPKAFPLILAAAALTFCPADRAANAQAADETAKRFNYLPLIADGGGIRSTLLITNVASSANSCSLAFLFDQIDASDFETHDRLTPGGAGGEIELPASAHVSITSGDGPALAIDSATLECAEPVVARVLISLRAGGTVQTAGVLPSAGTGANFSFPAMSAAFGDLFLIAYNQQGAAADCRIELVTETGGPAGESSFSVPGRATFIRTLAETVRPPADFGRGSATVSCDRFVAATGLLVGSALSGLPPVVLQRLPGMVTPAVSDLAVDSVSVSDDTLETGDSFTLRATVRNRGDGQAGSTTLRYYRSTNSAISTGDTQVGTDAVGTLGALAASPESISLTAPSTAGTYYYGACVDSVQGEGDTDNNCSNGVRVTVSSGTTDPPPGDGACVEVSDVIEIGEGESCTVTQALVDKYSLNSVSVNAGDTAMCSGGRVRLGFLSARSISLNGLTIRCR